MTTCPRDTNGDGNCGQPACPICGIQRAGVRAIIAGGRNFYLRPEHRAYLDTLNAELSIAEVVCGGASGADEDGARWGMANHIVVTKFPADWVKHGRAAGPKRNQLMAAHAAPCGVCILFPGGRGTASMRDLALKAKLRVFEWPSLEITSPACAH